MPYRFVHTADIHLDSPLKSLALRNSELQDLIGNATRQAFVRIIDLCLEEQVDALMIAGDLYDGEQTSMKTARFLAEQLRRIDEAGIDVFVIRGNHDALSKITHELVLPDRVTVFGGRADGVEILRSARDFPVVVHGMSFARPQAPESLLPKYRPPVDGVVNIGLMHTSLGGALGHDVYAPCSLAELQSSGFRYWALGHIHVRSVQEGPCTVVMPGIPQGRDINESGAKSCSLVTIFDDRSIRVEERFTSIARFERLSVDASGLDDWKDLVSNLTETLVSAQDSDLAGHLVARLRVVGMTPLAWQVRRDIELLKTEAEDKASMLGQCWIESIETACTELETKGAAEAGDPVSELSQLMDKDILASTAFIDAARDVADDLHKSLPTEMKQWLGGSQAEQAELLADMAREGVADVLSRLKGTVGGGQA